MNQHGNASAITNKTSISSSSTSSKKNSIIMNSGLRSPPLPLPQQVQSVSSTIQYPMMNTSGMMTAIKSIFEFF